MLQRTTLCNSVHSFSRARRRVTSSVRIFATGKLSSRVILESSNTRFWAFFKMDFSQQCRTRPSPFDFECANSANCARDSSWPTLARSRLSARFVVLRKNIQIFQKIHPRYWIVLIIYCGDRIWCRFGGLYRTESRFWSEFRLRVSTGRLAVTIALLWMFRKEFRPVSNIEMCARKKLREWDFRTFKIHISNGFIVAAT